VTILGILVTRSVRRRRQRNGAFLAALASGTPSVRRGNNGVPEKPVLWESLITSVDDEGNGWAEISVRHFFNSLIIICILRAFAMVSL